jgi:hypothetical protein
MSLIKKMRKQNAIWWSAGPKDEFGSISFAAPVQIKCRWEEKNGQIMGAQGQIITGLDTVYVDRDMKIGDKLKEGTLATDTPVDPKDDREAFEIQGWEKTPNLKAKEFLRIAYL